MSSTENGEARRIQCPRCGRLVDRLISGACSECFVETASIVRVPKIHLTVCPLCLRYKEGSTWRDGEFDLGSTVAATAREKLLRKLKIADEALGAGEGGAKPTISDVRVRNLRMSKDKVVLDSVAAIEGLAGQEGAKEILFSAAASLNTSACRTCQLRQADFYACILQVRAEDRVPEEEELELIGRIVEVASDVEQPQRYVTKIVDRKEGRDFYLPSAAFGRDIAKEVAAALGGTPRETRKLVGVDKSSSKKLYRITVLLRLPGLRIGDITELSGKLHAVLRNSNQSTALVDLDGNVVLHDRRSGDLPLVSRREKVGEALVLEVRPDGIQILDPRSNQTVDLLVGGLATRAGDTVSVVWRDGLPYLAPKATGEVSQGE